MRTVKPMSCRRQSGVSLIEVLVSVIIVVIGLLGLAGLQSHATLAEMEAFQRAQALVLLQDMVDRVSANRLDPNVSTPGAVGTDMSVAPCNALASVKARDHCEWSNALLGAAESKSGQRVGAMVGARGCVTQVVGPAAPREYEVTVVWQGLTTTKAPGTACGQNQYGDERMRRAVTARVRIACLENNPATGTCLNPNP
jgi:type IV pilus assembly protein PilV